MPMSEDALKFARTLAASKYCYPDDRLAAADLMELFHTGCSSDCRWYQAVIRYATSGFGLSTTEYSVASPEITRLCSPRTLTGMSPASVIRCTRRGLSPKSETA